MTNLRLAIGLMLFLGVGGNSYTICGPVSGPIGRPDPRGVTPDAGDPTARPFEVATDRPAAAPSAGAGASDAPKPGDPFRHPAPTGEELDRLLKSGFATEVRVDRVLVPAVVTDRKGRPILDLDEKDFELKEDQVPQRIDYFHVDQNEGVSIAFLVDMSGSMRLQDKVGEAREAIRFFLDGLRKNDQVAVLTFADGSVETLAPFGTRPGDVLARLELVKAYGQTALHDAIAAAPGIVDAEQRGRKAIVLITDGIDTASKISLFEAMSSARRVDVPMYTIGFASHSEEDARPDEAGTNAEILKLVSTETGGAFFWIADPDDMKEALRSVEDDLRSQYVLGYTPPRTKCDGSFRRIDLKVSKRHYNVRTRKGYVAGPC